MSKLDLRPDDPEYRHLLIAPGGATEHHREVERCRRLKPTKRSGIPTAKGAS